MKKIFPTFESFITRAVNTQPITKISESSDFNLDNFKIKNGEFISRTKSGDTGYNNMIAINKKSNEEFIIAKINKDKESYNTNGSKVASKTRTTYSLTWYNDSLEKMFGRKIKIHNSSRMANDETELVGIIGNYSKISLTQIKSMLAEIKK